MQFTSQRDLNSTCRCLQFVSLQIYPQCDSSESPSVPSVWADKTRSSASRGSRWRQVRGVRCPAVFGAEPGWDAELLPTAQWLHEKCLKHGRDLKGQQDQWENLVLPLWHSSWDEYFIFFFFFFPLCTGLCNNIGKLLKTSLASFGSDPLCYPQVKMLIWPILSSLSLWNLQNIKGSRTEFQILRKAGHPPFVRNKTSLFLIFYAYGFKDRSEDDE